MGAVRAWLYSWIIIITTEAPQMERHNPNKRPLSQTGISEFFCSYTFLPTSWEEEPHV